MKTYARASAAALLFALAACLAEAQDAAPGWGTVQGQAVYGGDKIPTPVQLKVNPARCKGPVFDETWVVNAKDKGLRDVFLWLEDANGKPLPVHPTLQAVPQKDAVLDQQDGRFEPHVLAMRAGQNLLMQNSSPVVHVQRIWGSPLVNPGLSFLMQPKATRTIKGLKADPMPLAVCCAIDRWMEAWVRVFDHPYYAVSRVDGTFTIPLAPAGAYRLKVWHPGSGWLGGAKGRAGMPITIAPNQGVNVGQLKLGPTR